MPTREYLDYINLSPIWQDKRHRVLVVRAGGRCEKMTPEGRCTAPATHCHHLTYVRLFHERLEDLQALCETHHRAEHVWEKNPRCRRCSRRVFADMEEVLGFVELNEHLSWDELYDDLPAVCARCVDAVHRAGLLRGNGQAAHPNGHDQPAPNTRTPMATNSRANRTTPIIAPPTDDDLDELEEEEQPKARAKSKGKAKAKAEAEATITWTRWPALEAMMDRKGAMWEYRENVPLSAIDVDKSRKNTTRLGDRIVESYIESLEIEARDTGRLILPAVLAWWATPEGLGETLDGNHRDEVARRLGLTHAHMYVLLDPGTGTVASVRRGANLLSGMRATTDEQMQNAASQYWEGLKTKGSLSKAAAENGVKRATLADFVHAEEMAQLFSADGDMPIPDAVKFNAATRCQLWKIQNQNALRIAATRLADFDRPTSRHAEQAWRAYKVAPKTEEDQVAAVAAVFDRMVSEQAEDMRAKNGPAAVQLKFYRMIKEVVRRTKEYAPAGVDLKDVIPDPKIRVAIRGLCAEFDVESRRIQEGLA